MSQQPYPQPAPPPPPPNGRWQPERIDAVPGTEFGLVQLRVEPITSGMATGSLVAGIGAILVSLVAFCFGLLGASYGWGALVAGAFTLLSVIAGVGAIIVGVVARRQIRTSGRTGQVRFTGRGIATGGIWCGAAGAGMGLLGLALSLVLQLSS
jgi:hypothetical protein